MDDYWQRKKNLEKEGRKLYDQQIFRDWCKGCGICVSFCPRQVYQMDEFNKPVVVNADDCIGCRFCVFHCPDFAITIIRRFSDRRKKADHK